VFIAAFFLLKSGNKRTFAQKFDTLMKTKILFMVAVITTAISCKTQNEPEHPDTKTIVPTASFTYTSNELKVQFTNTSKNATSYEWDFGDNSSAITANPTHTYSKSGTYVVTLTAYYEKASDKKTQSIYVSFDKPIANFSFKVTQPMTVILTNESYGATSYLWDFGDGQTSTDKNPTHRYTKIGIYEIKLTAIRGDQTDNLSLYASIEKPTHIYIKGFRYTQIPYNNKYYYVKVIDDDVFTTTWVRTTATLLSSSILPYDFILANPKELTGLDEDDYYTMQLYYSSSSSGDGTLVTGYKMTKSQILEYPASLTGRGTSNELTIFFDYK